MYPAVETSAALQLPIKVIATALGAQFQVHTTEGQQSHYTLTYNDRIITVRPNEAQYTVSSRNQNKPKEAQVITLSEPIGNYSGAVTAPYEMFQGLGLNVTWDRSRAALNMDDTNQAASAH
jgi:ribosomal protein L6P/L9E